MPKYALLIDSWCIKFVCIGSLLYSLLSSLFALGDVVFKVFLFDLEFLVLMKDVLVQRLREHTVYLLCQVNLSHLELGQGVGHDGVREIGLDHLLEHVHILGSELSHALVEHSSDVCITCDLPINDLLDV